MFSFGGSGGDADERDPFRELMIVNPKVLNTDRAKAGGEWHFSTLMRNMLPSDTRNPMATAEFIETWLNRFATVTEVAGTDDAIATRNTVFDEIICPWRNASTGREDCSGRIDPNIAPFRLLAIVYRPDLRDNSCGQAGEGRLVFGLIDNHSTSPQTNGDGRSMTVIFEYGLPTHSHDAVDWANRWTSLSQHSCGKWRCSRTYKNEVAKIVADFAGADADPSKPFGNALNQLRTNEIELAAPWELREFHLRNAGGGAELQQVTVKVTPKSSLNNSDELVEFIKANEQAVRSFQLDIPERMLGASAQTVAIPFVNNITSKWLVGRRDLPEDLRFAFASQTCNGCHGDESRLASLGNLRQEDTIETIGLFYHISPNARPGRDGQGILSSFLKDEDIPRRVGVVENILANGCRSFAIPCRLARNGPAS